jgi:MFS superfamily sulfate permease-like transporter
METLPGGIVYRFDSTLFFANAEHFRARVLSLVESAPHPVTWMAFDFSAIADVDYTAGQMLLALLRNLAHGSVSVHLAHVEDIADVLRRYGILDLVDADHIHHGIREAVAAASAAPSPG